MAIVVDEYGAMIGLVTMQDLLEELFGELRDEDSQVVDLDEHGRPLSNDAASGSGEVRP